MTMQNCLEKARLGRSAVRHLDTLIATHTLTPDELNRCVKRIRDGFDAVLGVAPPPPAPERGPFTVVRGALS